jgi:hypothetical protein
VTVYAEKEALLLQGNSFTCSCPIFKHLEAGAAKGRISGEGKTIHIRKKAPSGILFLTFNIDMLKNLWGHGTLIALSFGRTEKDGSKAVLLKGIHRVGLCPQRRSGFSLRRSNRGKLAAADAWRSKKREEGELQ